MTVELRALLEAIVANVDEAITVVDPTGHFVFVNDDAARLLGFQSAAELLAADPKTVRDRYQVVDERRQPVPVRQMPAAVAFGGQTPPEMLVGWRIDPSAELRWSITRSVPLKDDAGRVQLVINFFKDVTDQRRREAEELFLATATMLFSQSLENDVTLQKLARLAVPELADWAVVELVDPTAPRLRPRRVAVAHVDPEKLARSEEVSLRWPTPWNPDAERGVAAVIRTGRPETVPIVGSERLERYAQSPEHLEALKAIGLHSFLCVPLLTHSQHVVGVLSLLTAEGRRTYEPRDIEFALEFGRRAGTAIENARLFAALENANREKDQFLAMLGHELRNPLGPMVNAVRLMKSPQTAERAQAVLDRQLGQLTRLVDDLLDVSRVSRGKIELTRETLDLSALLQALADDYRDALGEAGLTLELDCPGPASVSGDRVRLQQVAGNLLGNAVKFTPRGGRVRLSLKCEGGWARVTVTDSGAGIDAAMIPRLFQPFVQADRSLERESGGLGLGLAVVRGLIELHGGTVTVRSDGLGRGTTFEVAVPLVSAAPVAQTPTVAPSTAAAPRPMRVLVIDDNVDLAITMRDLLAFEAQEVEVEHSGVNAVETIRRMKPDVVICDIGLPVKDGYAIAREVRADPSLAKVKLVALSGYGLDADKERAQAAGFTVHLTKPVPPDLLLSLVTDS